MEFPSQIDLVAAAKRATGIDTDDGLARHLGQRYGIQVGQSAVWRWANGETKEGPRYNTAIVLMHIAGWLNEDQIQTAEGLAAAASREAAAVEEETRPLEQRSQEHPQSETG